MPRALACAFVRTPIVRDRPPRKKKEKRKEKGGGRIKEIQTYSEKLPDHRGGGGSASGPGWYTLVRGRHILYANDTLSARGFVQQISSSSLVINRPIMLNVATDRRVFEHLSRKARLELLSVRVCFQRATMKSSKR